MTKSGSATSDAQARVRRIPGQLWMWIAASSVSALGGGVVQVGLSWSAAWFGGRVAGWISALSMLPMVLLALVGGAVGDRFGQRRTLVVATCASVVQYASFLVLLGLDVPLLWLLLVNAVLTGGLAAGLVGAVIIPCFDPGAEVGFEGLHGAVVAAASLPSRRLGQAGRRLGGDGSGK